MKPDSSKRPSAPGYPPPMEPSRAGRPLFWGIVALAAAAVGALVAVALAASGPGPPPPPAGITLEVDRAWARAGGTIQLRVLAPRDARQGDEALYGIPSILERKVGDRWVPTHHLGFGLDHDSSKPYYARYGDPTFAWYSIGLSGDHWRPLAIPSDAEPGLHRIVLEVGVPGRPFAVPFYLCQACAAAQAWQR